MCTVMAVKLGATGQLNWNDTVCWLFPQFAFIAFALHPVISSHPPSSCTDAKWKLCQLLQLTPSLQVLPQDYPNCSPLSYSHCPTLGIAITVRDIYRKERMKTEVELVTKI